MNSHSFQKTLCLLIAGIALLTASAQAADYKSKGKQDIGNFMERLHKGKTSYAVQARQGKLNSRQLNALAGQYRQMMNLTPPKNKQLWRKSVTDLILSTQRLARKPSDRGLLAAYTKAVDCNGCHRRHR